MAETTLEFEDPDFADPEQALEYFQFKLGQAEAELKERERALREAMALVEEALRAEAEAEAEKAKAVRSVDEIDVKLGEAGSRLAKVAALSMRRETLVEELQARTDELTGRVRQRQTFERQAEPIREQKLAAVRLVELQQAKIEAARRQLAEEEMRRKIRRAVQEAASRQSSPGPGARPASGGDPSGYRARGAS